MTQEIWKSIPGYETYQVSNYGRVKNKSGHVVRPFKTGIKKKQYLTVKFYLGNYKTKQERVHRLVLMAFERMPVQGEVGCHRNDDTFNNTLENLYWGTQKQNMSDSKNNGTFYRNGPKGEKHGQAKLSDADIALIKKLKKSGLLQKNIARLFKIDPSSVSKILNGHRRVS